MKKIIAFIAVLIVLYSVYFDLKIGTIPHAALASETKQTAAVSTEAAKPKPQNNSFKIIEVKPGDTVLSIVQKLQPNKVPVDKIIKDFTKLNPGVKPTEIQIGQVYRFPYYKHL